MSSIDLRVMQQHMKNCRRCLEEGYQITPGAIFSGTASADIMLVGQAPGITEVSAGRPFNAGSGKRLFEWLARAGFTETGFRERQYMTAITKCFPGKNSSGRGDRVPSRDEQQLCRDNLIQELNHVNPSLILPIGKLAIDVFLNKPKSLADVVGRAFLWEAKSGTQRIEPGQGELTRLETLPIKSPDNSRWIIPLPHPSGASIWPNRPKNKQLIYRSIELLDDLANRFEISRK